MGDRQLWRKSPWPSSSTGALHHLVSHAWAPLWETKKDAPWLRKWLVQRYACCTHGQSLVLCPGTASRAPFLRDDLQRMGLQRGRLSVTCTSSAVAKQPLDLIWPLQQPQIPAEPVHPYTGTGNAKAEIVFLANWLSHLLSVCWSFLVLFCFRLGVGVDVTLQS